MNSEESSTAPSFFAVARSRSVVIPAIKVALFVGTLLALINHAEKFASLAFSASDLFKILLTYLVPYGVSTWSAVKAIRTM